MSTAQPMCSVAMPKRRAGSVNGVPTVTFLDSNGAVMDQSVQNFCEKCGFLRLDLAQKYASKHKAFEKTSDMAKDFRFLWVSDFPMFEWDKEEKA